jgi:hypothetical protein
MKNLFSKFVKLAGTRNGKVFGIPWYILDENFPCFGIILFGFKFSMTPTKEFTNESDLADFCKNSGMANPD